MNDRQAQAQPQKKRWANYGLQRRCTASSVQKRWDKQSEQAKHLRKLAQIVQTPLQMHTRGLVDSPEKRELRASGDCLKFCLSRLNTRQLYDIHQQVMAVQHARDLRSQELAPPNLTELLR